MYVFHHLLNHVTGTVTGGTSNTCKRAQPQIKFIKYLYIESVVWSINIHVLMSCAHSYCTYTLIHTCTHMSNLAQRLFDTKGGGGQSSGKMASHSISTNALPTTPATTVVFTGKILEKVKNV